jgi:dihydrofolate synthase / folylpolyglutamate synthase
MRPLESYHESLEFLYELRGGSIDLRLNRVALALGLFENPQNCFEAFHVAGTNGKGSTAAMLHQILTAGGYRVGLYTSPHLDAFTERIRVGDQDITEKDVTGYIHEIWEGTNRADISLTFFEFVTVMALLHFARERVDAAVIEVGLGGRLDATNLVRPVVSIVTSISMDHEAFLGSDIPSIAYEKAGIIKQQIPVVCGPLPPDAMDVIEGVSRAKDSRLYKWKRDFSMVCGGGETFDYHGKHWDFDGIELRLRGNYQRRNAAVAIAAMELARSRFPVDEAALRWGLLEVRWPGRLEVLSQKPTIVLDGAHNVEGVKTLVSELPSVVGDRKVRLLFGSMIDKDWRTMLPLISKMSSEVVLTRVPMPKSAAPDALSQVLLKETPVKIVADPVEALLRLITDTEKVDIPILVAGSLYLLGPLRRHALRIVAQPGA